MYKDATINFIRDNKFWKMSKKREKCFWKKNDTRERKMIREVY